MQLLCASRTGLPGRRATSGWALVALATGLVSWSPGCRGSADGEACRTGDDPMAWVSISTEGCQYGECWQSAAPWFDFVLSGDATVTSLTHGEPGEHLFDLYFPTDATTVSFTATLPEGVGVPLAEGDVVAATLSVTWGNNMWSPGMVSSSIWIGTDTGTLISSSWGSLTADPAPPVCKSARMYGDCTIGYPDLSFCHPSEDPLAPCLDLREGESGDLLFQGTAYTVYVPTAFVLVPPGHCTDVPPGHHSTTRLRRFDLESP